MRAKEYIYLHKQELKYAEYVSEAIKDLLPLRMDKSATCEYMNAHLSADIRYQHYLLQKELFERRNVMQPNAPAFSDLENEVPMDVVAQVRKELFKVIEEDPSFGYLYYILGTEQNARHNSEPIDCIPNEKRIADGIILNRDDYPKDNLDEYINDDLNYHQYNKIADGHYWDDDDAIYLRYFNTVYAIYDELRIHRHSISKIKSYLKGLKFNNDVEKYWIFEFIIKLMEESSEEDESLNRCKQELHRVIEPMKQIINPETAQSCNSPVFLSERKGAKIDIIRVFNALYELGCFTGEGGKSITKKEFMKTMGNAINIDLTNYDKDLSRSLSDSTALDKHLKIFRDLEQKMTDIFNLH